MPKFTKEQAVEALNSRFATNGGKTSLQLSERSVSETLDAILPLAGDEMEMDVFIDTIAFKAIDTMNRNFIHESSEFAKKYKPQTPQTDPQKDPQKDPPISAESIQEMIKTAMTEQMSPLKEQLQNFASQKNLNERKQAVNAKKEELKLSQAWSVDFDNAVLLAEYKLGESATADQIFEEAKTSFNATLSARGEKYEPKKSSQEPEKADFKAAAERRKKEKELRDKANGKNTK